MHTEEKSTLRPLPCMQRSSIGGAGRRVGEGASLQRLHSGEHSALFSEHSALKLTWILLFQIILNPKNSVLPQELIYTMKQCSLFNQMRTSDHNLLWACPTLWNSCLFILGLINGHKCERWGRCPHQQVVFNFFSEAAWLPLSHWRGWAETEAWLISF